MVNSILLIESNSRRLSVLPLLSRSGMEIALLKETSLADSKTLRKGLCDVVVFNAISFRRSGVRVAKRIKQYCDAPLLLIAGLNDPVSDLADAWLFPPFKGRKLLNRIKELVPMQVGTSLKVGEIEVCKDLPMVLVRGRQEKLTPKAHALLLQLVRSAGKTVSREQLFKKVWQTDYIGDTRTLDVHIRWLREAIEEDPRTPKLLMTERGKGYRFLD